MQRSQIWAGFLLASSLLFELSAQDPAWQWVVAGPYQGWVFVWEGDAGYRPGRFIPGFTRYSLINPKEDPTQPTGPVMFRNYYVELGGTANGTAFCTGGSCWRP